MKKTIYSVFLIITAMIILGLGSCRPYAETEQYKSKGRKASNFNISEINVSWKSVYAGTTFSTNSSDIDVLFIPRILIIPVY